MDRSAEPQLREEERLEASLAELRRVNPPADLTEAVMRRLPRRPVFLGLTSLEWGAVCASLLAWAAALHLMVQWVASHASL